MTEKNQYLVETHGRVGVVRINRPKSLNALNGELVAGIMNSLDEFDEDDNIGAMVITGNEKAFAAGADITEMVDATPVSMLDRGHIAPFDRIKDIHKPVIAAVSGWCLGGGNELAMSCDMLVASETARFGQPEINLGVMPGAGGTQRLARTVGKAITMEMVLNNRVLTAEEAYQFGLVSRVVPTEVYLDEAIKLGQELAERAPLAVRFGKRAVNHAFESFLSDGIADERQSFYYLFATQDQKEGMQAFIEKRKPEWKGE